MGALPSVPTCSFCAAFVILEPPDVYRPDPGYFMLVPASRPRYLYHYIELYHA